MSNQHEDRGHAEFSPSNAHRWLVCASSIEMSRGMPDTSSAAAEEGTRAHEYLDQIAKGEIDSEDIPEDDQYMVPDIEIALNYYDHLVDAHSGDKHADEMIEDQINLEHLGGDCWGTLDYSICSPSVGIEIVDFKFGRHPVEADNNEQLLTYLVGRCEEVGYDFPEFRLTIVQPRAAHIKGPIRTCTVTANRVKAFKAKLVEGIKDCKKETTMLVAGPHCQYCKGAGRCPEIRTEAQNIARTEFANFEPTPAKQLADADLALVVENTAAFKTWLESANEELLRRMKSGASVLDMKIVQKVSKARWIESEYEQFVEDNLEEDDRYRVIPHTITEMRKIIKDYELDADVLNTVIERPAAGLAVASVDDGRIEYIPPALEFKKVR